MTTIETLTADLAAARAEVVRATAHSAKAHAILAAASPLRTPNEGGFLDRACDAAQAVRNAEWAVIEAKSTLAYAVRTAARAA